MIPVTNGSPGHYSDVSAKCWTLEHFDDGCRKLRDPVALETSVPILFGQCHIVWHEASASIRHQTTYVLAAIVLGLIRSLCGVLIKLQLSVRGINSADIVCQEASLFSNVKL